MRGQLTAELQGVKVFVLSVPAVGNDPSGQSMHVSACELKCQVLMMMDGGAAHSGGRCLNTA